MKTSFKQPSLKTPRLILNQFTLGDAPEVNAICSNKAIADTTAHIPHPYTKEMATEWIQTHKDNYQAGKSAIFAIRVQSNNQLILMINVKVFRKLIKLHVN